MSLLSAHGLVKRFAGFLATDHVSLDILPGELHAVIGPNGAGKTTLINLLSGNLQPDSGSIVLEGQNITWLSADRRARLGIGRSYQITSTFTDLTVLENVMLAVQGTSERRLGFLRPVSGDPHLTEPACQALEQVQLESRSHEQVRHLAHGARRQLELAMTIAMQPKLLLLDEPMAGMSHHESGTMSEMISRLKGRYSILLIEHDMDVVFSLADRISVLVYGKTLMSGTAKEVRNHPEVKLAYLGDEDVVL